MDILTHASGMIVFMIASRFADFLRPLFEVLYDEEIISEDSVVAWEKNDEVSVGKGSALTSVAGFLTWLKTSEEESPDESK